MEKINKKKITEADLKLLKNELNKLQNIPLSEGLKLVKSLTDRIETLDFETESAFYAQILTEIGIFYGVSGYCDQARPYFGTVIALAEKHDEELASAKNRAESNLAICEAQTGNYLAAIDIWEEMLLRDQEESMKLALINNIAVGYSAVGHQDKALSRSFEALKLAEDLQDEKNKLPPLMNIANAYLRSKDFEKAESYVLKALELSRKYDNIRTKCDSLNNLSLIYRQTKDFPKALQAAERCLHILEKYYAKHEHAQAYNNIGIIYEDMGDNDKALEYFHKSLKLVSENANKADIVNMMLNIIRLLGKMDRYDEALSYSQDADKLLQELKNPALLIRYYHHMSRIHAYMQDFEKAYNLQSTLEELLVKQNQEALTSSINKTEADYYRKKIEQQAENYRLQNEELKKKNRIIQKNSRELNKINKNLEHSMEAFSWLVKVISHDVRAPLANFAKMIDLILSEAFEDSEINDVLRSLKTSSQNTFKLVDEMLDGIRLQRRNLADEAKIIKQDLIPHLQQIYLIYRPVALQKHVNLNFEYPDGQVYAQVDSDLLKIVVRNLINNAIKFTPESGSVNLKLSKTGQKVMIQIIDSGEGMSKQKIKELMSDKAQSSLTRSADGGIGLGWILLNESIQKMNGNMKVESVLGLGTTVTITLPT